MPPLETDTQLALEATEVPALPVLPLLGHLPSLALVLVGFAEAVAEEVHLQLLAADLVGGFLPAVAEEDLDWWLGSLISLTTVPTLDFAVPELASSAQAPSLDLLLTVSWAPFRISDSEGPLSEQN